MVANKRGLTLLEVAISAVVLSIIMAVLLGTTDSTLRVSATSASIGDAQIKAESTLALVERELMLGGPLGSSGEISVVDGGSLDFVVTYMPQTTGALVYDKTNPEAGPWATARRRIQFEHTEDARDGNDDDGDFLIDEGEIVLYEETGANTNVFANPVVLARDVKAFNAVLTVPSAASTYPELQLGVELERVLFKAIKSNADLTALRAGNGPRTTHSASTTLSLMN